jgi:hypothetical protein
MQRGLLRELLRGMQYQNSDKERGMERVLE